MAYDVSRVPGMYYDPVVAGRMGAERMDDTHAEARETRARAALHAAGRRLRAEPSADGGTTGSRLGNQSPPVGQEDTKG